MKCVFCNGNHPANYKGCAVFKELQKTKFPTLRQKISTNIQTTVRQEGSKLEESNTPIGTTYTKTADRNNRPIPINHHINFQPEKLNQTQSNDLQSNILQDLKDLLQAAMNQMIADKHAQT